MRFGVVLEREANGGYVASVPALPRCVSRGDNRREALGNIREAINLYLADPIDAGEQVPVESACAFVDVEAP